MRSPLVSLDSCDISGPSSGPELKHRGILEAKSDEVKKTKNKKNNNVCVRIRPHTCVGEWHEIRIIPHSVPVAKQTGCNVYEMTFALPEEFGISLSCGFAFRAEARARESKSLNRERKGKE